jgi:hypothetical protein
VRPVRIGERGIRAATLTRLLHRAGGEGSERNDGESKTCCRGDVDFDSIFMICFVMS